MIDLKSVMSENEHILWEGRPNKKCFILESVFNPLLPFALIWACIDIFVVGLSFGEEGGVLILGFMMLHMMPVWIYLFGVIFSFRRFKNTQFIVTDIGLYVSGGAFSYAYKMRPWADLGNISLRRGIFDQWLKVGDVVFDTGEFVRSSRGHSTMVTMEIINIPDYEEVFKMVKKLQRDIHADTMYPNDLRPSENHGYHSEYKN